METPFSLIRTSQSSPLSSDYCITQSLPPPRVISYICCCSPSLGKPECEKEITERTPSTHRGLKNGLFNRRCWEGQIVTGKRMKLDFFLMPNSEWIKNLNLNLRPEMTPHLKDNKRGTCTPVLMHRLSHSQDR